jgi:predicted DNA-binding transcriptional regulator
MERGLQGGMADDPARDSETGQWKSAFEAEDVLAFVEEQDGATSGDIKREFDCSYDTARRRLEELYDRGDVDRREFAAGYLYTPKNE